MMKFEIFVSILMGGLSLGLNINAGPLIPQALKQKEAYIYAVWANDTITKNFDMHQYPTGCCSPNNLTVFKAYLYDAHAEQDQTFRLPFTLDKQISVHKITSRNYYAHQKMITEIEPTGLVNATINTFMVSHLCARELTDLNYWSVIEISIHEKNQRPIKFQYQLLCDVNYHPNRFDWSSVVLVMLASTSIFFLARQGKLFSFKILFRKAPRKIVKMATGQVREDEHIFQGFFLSLKHALIYIPIMSTILILSVVYEQAFESHLESVVMVVTAVLALHFFDEVHHHTLSGKCLCHMKELKVKVLWRVRIRHLYSLFLAFTLMSLYLFWEKSWFLSDLLSLCIMGSLVKMYKFISLRDAVMFLLPTIIMDLALFIYVLVKVRYEWDSVAIRYFNTPLFFQLPYLVYIYKKKCAWISIINILFPGFFIGLAYRFDQCKRTVVYQIISFCGLFVGMLTWLTIQSIYTLPVPVSLFTTVPMLSLSAFFAWRRYELQPFWTGMFYDSLLLEPFKGQLQEDGRDSVISLTMFAKKQNPDIEMEVVDNRSEGSAGNYVSLVKQDANGQMDLNSGLFHGLGIKQ